MMLERFTLSARKPLIADIFVNGAAQHVVLLHRRKQVDLMVLGVGLEIVGDPAGRGVLTEFFQGQHSQTAVEHQETRRL